jgi:hypothetical protein
VGLAPSIWKKSSLQKPPTRDKPDTSVLREDGVSKIQLERLARDRDALRAFVGGLCTSKGVEGR